MNRMFDYVLSVFNVLLLYYNGVFIRPLNETGGFPGLNRVLSRKTWDFKTHRNNKQYGYHFWMSFSIDGMFRPQQRCFASFGTACLRFFQSVSAQAFSASLHMCPLRDRLDKNKCVCSKVIHFFGGCSVMFENCCVEWCFCYVWPQKGTLHGGLILLPQVIVLVGLYSCTLHFPKFCERRQVMTG